MGIFAVTDNHEASGIDISNHRLHLHGANHVLMQAFIKPFRTAKHMPFHNFNDIGKRKSPDMLRGFRSTRTVPIRSFVTTMPRLSASFTAR